MAEGRSDGPAAANLLEEDSDYDVTPIVQGTKRAELESGVQEPQPKKNKNQEDASSSHGSVQRSPQRKSEPITSLKSGTWYSFIVPESTKIAELYLCEELLKEVLRNGRPYPPRDDSNYLYHGTDQGAALNILKTGIKLEKGKGSQDFSHEDGFYVSYDFEKAKSWAEEFSKQGFNTRSRKKFNHKRENPAVIVFRSPKLEKYKLLSLVGDEDVENWQKLIKYNRSGRNMRQHYLVKELKSQFEESHCVVGPMSEAKENRDFDSWVPHGSKDLDNRQLCVRNEDFAKDFKTEFMESIILYGELTKEQKLVWKNVVTTK